MYLQDLLLVTGTTPPMNHASRVDRPTPQQSGIRYLVVLEVGQTMIKGQRRRCCRER